MWSFGVLLWELNTREVPFADLSPMEIGMKVIHLFLILCCAKGLLEGQEFSTLSQNLRLHWTNCLYNFEYVAQRHLVFLLVNVALNYHQH